MRHANAYFWLAFAVFWLAGMFIKIYDVQWKPNQPRERYYVATAYVSLLKVVHTPNPHTWGCETVFAGTIAFVHTSAALMLATLLVSPLRRQARIANETAPPVAIAWFDAAQFERLLRSAADVETLGPSYEIWQEDVRRDVINLVERGFRIELVPLDAEALDRWCKAAGRPNDAEAREAFAERTRQDGYPESPARDSADRFQEAIFAKRNRNV